MDRDVVAAAIVLFETPRGDRPDVTSLRSSIREHKDSLAALLAAPRSDGARRRWEERKVRSEARERAARLMAGGGRLIFTGAPGFPSRLAALDWGPPWLFVRGPLPFPEYAAAIVGTRRATPSALEFARELAEEVAAMGVAVVSGMARGIDAAAHHGALAVPEGETVAVLGTGVDVCYPAANRKLYALILDRGLLVSELPPGSPPLRHHFPMRNRILAALARAVVVVQAPQRSGALVTAAHAADAGSEVLAVPGDPILPENAGSNALLAAGARVTLGVDDVLSAVLGHEVIAARGATARPQSTRDATLAASDRALLLALDLVPREVDEVVESTGREIAEVLSGLLRLEVAGLVESVEGGRVRWTPRAARQARPG